MHNVKETKEWKNGQVGNAVKNDKKCDEERQEKKVEVLVSGSNISTMKRIREIKGSESE